MSGWYSCSMTLSLYVQIARPYFVVASSQNEINFCPSIQPPLLYSKLLWMTAYLLCTISHKFEQTILTVPLAKFLNMRFETECRDNITLYDKGLQNEMVVNFSFSTQAPKKRRSGFLSLFLFRFCFPSPKWSQKIIAFSRLIKKFALVIGFNSTRNDD